MAFASEMSGGRESARTVPVWDPLVRLIHWSLALAIVLNGAVTEDEGKLHEWVGYAALALVGLRLLWAFLGPRHARFSAFPPSPVRAARHVGSILRGERIVHLSHNPLGALMVYNIWLTVIVIGVTGYMMTTFRFYGIAWVADAHVMAFNWLLVSIVLHLAGVAFDTWRSGVNLVRAMFDGRKRVRRNVKIE